MKKLLSILLCLCFLSSSVFAGRAGLQTGTPTKITVGNTSTLILAASDTREYIGLVNDSNENIYVSFGSAAVMNQGLRLNSNGGSVVFKFPQIPYVAIYGICSSGGKNLTVQTGE
ncbi:MAG: hypothetical protein ACFFE4_00495 [Candidatus Thorarchaeota archaeon]